MRFQTVFAVRVENCRVAERLALDHFAKFNVRREFGKSARQSMSLELAHIAQMVGVECFRIDLEAAKAVLRMIGEEVALAASWKGKSGQYTLNRPRQTSFGNPAPDKASGD